MIHPLAAEAHAVFNECPICYHDSKAGYPISRPRTGTSPRPVMNQVAQQEVSGKWASKASSVLAATPQRWH